MVSIIGPSRVVCTNWKYAPAAAPHASASARQLVRARRNAVDDEDRGSQRQRQQHVLHLAGRQNECGQMPARKNAIARTRCARAAPCRSMRTRRSAQSTPHRTSPDTAYCRDRRNTSGTSAAFAIAARASFLRKPRARKGNRQDKQRGPAQNRNPARVVNCIAANELGALPYQCRRAREDEFRRPVAHRIAASE